jgi:FKBP-type peptidyl-prolyl cis-trans isomerase 2
VEGMKTIMKNTVVSFRYIMRDAKGKVLEDLTSGEPTRYLHGSNEISLILQNQMEGMKEGETGDISLLESMGNASGDYFFKVFIETVRPANEEEILLGYPLTLSDCGEDCECHKN